MIKPQTYVRKPLVAEAVQVTEENIHEVAAWAKAEVVLESRHGRPTGREYIRVDVKMALNERQKKAYVNDWVVRIGTSYKVYKPESFTSSFDRKDAELTHDNYRDAKTGHFVSEQQAEANPDTTVKETP